VDPPALAATLVAGEQEIRSLILSNAGGSALDFSLQVRSRSLCDPTRAFVAEAGGERLSVVDLATGTITPVASGLNGPVKVALDAAETTVYVAESDSGRILAIDLSTGAVRVIADGLSNPHGLVLDADETTAYVTARSDGELLAVDLATGGIERVTFGLRSPVAVVLDAAGTTAYVAEWDGGEISAIDLATGIITQILERPVWDLKSPFDLTLDATGTITYVAEFILDRISAVDLTTGAVSPVASGIPRPTALTLNEAGTTLYVAGIESGELSSVDLASGAVAPVASGLISPTGVALDARTACPIGFLTANPALGSIPASGQAGIDVRLDTTGLFEGLFEAAIDVTSNDPAAPRLLVPVTLTVIGVPNIGIRGEAIVLESVQDYTTPEARTLHKLRTTVTPAGGGSIELIADGDYGHAVERATLIVEGTTLGDVGGPGSDCAPVSGTFALDAEHLGRTARWTSRFRTSSTLDCFAMSTSTRCA
jgi:sugar lactone lactonase YvrE